MTDKKLKRRRGRPPKPKTNKDAHRRPIGVYVDTKLWRKVRALALELDMTGGEALEEAMRLWLARHGRL